MNRRIVSAVDRVIEPPDLWTERLSHAQWGDRIPHLKRRADGADEWTIGGRTLALAAIADVGALLPERGGAPACWQEVPKAAYDPAARLNAMDTAGVAAAALYPSLAGFSGERFAAIPDLDFQLACVRAYNDWVIEEWSSASARFIPQCIVPITPIDAVVAEIERAAAKGHRGVIFPAAPMHVREVAHINDAAYDRIWAVCQDLDIPLCFHAGSAPELFQFPLPPRLAPVLAGALRAALRPAGAVFDLVNILFSRILLRFPKLRVVFAESTIGWGTFLLEYADHQYEQDHCDYAAKPSEMFRRQCYLTAWYDPVAINARYIGADNVLWATNFPAGNSTWPDTQDFVSRCLTGVADEARRQILWGNAARLYKIANP